jgi:hypothetical protein
LLGAFAALVPFIGPYFDLSVGSDDAWTWSGDRFLFSVLPGIVAVLGGLMLMGTTRRIGGGLGGWLALAAGIWLVVGQSTSLFWEETPGYGPAFGSDATQAVTLLAYFYATGAAITALAAFAMGRFSVRGIAEAEAERVEERGPVLAPPEPSTRVGPAHTDAPMRR